MLHSLSSGVNKNFELQPIWCMLGDIGDMVFHLMLEKVMKSDGMRLQKLHSDHVLLMAAPDFGTSQDASLDNVFFPS